MKKVILVCFFLWAAGYLLPLALTEAAPPELPAVSLPPAGGETDASSQPSEPALSPSPSPSPSPTPIPGDADIVLKVSVEGKIEEMTLADYLVGVLCAEMPALYPEEALKAQAVAARTYYAYRMLGGAGQYDGADMTDDSTVCMAYTAPAAMAGAWGGEAADYTARMRAAVTATDGMIMTGTDGEPIAAVFFAISSGKTESAKDIWGSDDPHLQSRDSSWDAEAPGFTGEVQITSEEFQEKFRAKYTSATFPVGKTWFSDWKRSDAGSVLSVKVGGVTVKGSDLRALLGLRSSNFSVSFAGGIYTFTTKGYGHGVGMSQYGARALALSGKGYAEILAAYYSDFKLEKIKG
ncbi:MAG: stage II sporulation protein D [Clostridia bacterium]|nr:stage II sporulation protein D [Clostridia bacterium]